MDERIVLLERLLLRAMLMELGRVAQESEPLTLSQFFALLATQRHDGGCTMGELAAETLLPRSTATSVVDRLVTLGLAERLRNDPSDRRQVRVRPTPEGLALLERVRQSRRADATRALPANADLDATIGLLQRYVETLAKAVYPDANYPPGLLIDSDD